MAKNDVPDREAIRAELEATRLAFYELLNSLSEADWRRKSATTAWTIGQLLMHLTQSLETVPDQVKSARKGKDFMNLPLIIFNPIKVWVVRLLARKEDDPMSVERNKAVVRSHFEEIWGKGNLDFVDENLTPDFVSHDPRGPEAPGVEGFRQYATMVRSAFPDISVTVEDVIAEGDKVAARAEFRATHQGEFQGIPPTGEEVTLSAIGIFRIAEGKIAEVWILTDDLGMLQQLGVVPPPGGAGG